MFSPEDLMSGGTLPTGPVSAWPKERHDKLMAQARAAEIHSGIKPVPENQPKPGLRKMASGLVKSGKQALVNGRVTSAVKEERIATCEQCPSFNKGSRRCNECGCFMDAKSWIGGDPDTLCPLKKWVK